MGCALLVIGARVVTTTLLRPTRVAGLLSLCLPLAMALGGLFREWAPVRTQRGAMDDTTTKSIAAFRLRAGLEVGCKVTLRRARMYEFLDRLISLALPRVRDFRGLNPKAFDGHGNYSLGLSEQLVFPELNPDKYTRVQGMNITICSSTDSDDESRELLKGFGLPFQREGAMA